MASGDSAIVDLGIAIEDGLYECDQMCFAIIDKLTNHLCEAVKDQDKAVNKIARKISGFIGRELAKQSNGIDQVATKLLAWIGGCAASNEWTLTGIAVKAGILGAGDSLDSVVWDQEPATSLGPEYGGTLVLDCRGLADQLAPLLEVLREIRDRMPALAITLPGETPELPPVADPGPLPVMVMATPEELQIYAASTV